MDQRPRPEKREEMARYVDIKICGQTTREDARAALDAGADFLGFVLYAKSPRAVTPSALRQILDSLPGRPRAVGVFVNERRAHVETIAADCGLYAVQLHGDERAEEFADMAVPVWRVVRVIEGAVQPAPAAWLAARYLMDASVRGKYGGTGQRADWRESARFAAKYPTMLAGGLTPENVTEAIQRVKPMGVDVVSGVEASPGKKDHGKIERFIQAVRRLGSQHEPSG